VRKEEKMKRKFLEDLGLTKEQMDSIMDENGKDIEEAKGNLDQVKTELDQTKTQLTDRDAQLETLKSASGDNETLRQQIADLQAENQKKEEDYKNEIKNLQLDSAIKAAIGESAQDADLVASLIDKGKLILGDDGKVTGLEEQMKTLRENKKFLFKEEKSEQTQGFRTIVGSGKNQEQKLKTENGTIDMKAAIAAKIQSQVND
jgi:hypothetical protein